MESFTMKNNGKKEVDLRSRMNPNQQHFHIPNNSNILTMHSMYSGGNGSNSNGMDYIPFKYFVCIFIIGMFIFLSLGISVGAAYFLKNDIDQESAHNRVQHVRFNERMDRFLDSLIALNTSTSIKFDDMNNKFDNFKFDVDSKMIHVNSKIDVISNNTNKLKNDNYNMLSKYNSLLYKGNEMEEKLDVNTNSLNQMNERITTIVQKLESTESRLNKAFCHKQFEEEHKYYTQQWTKKKVECDEYEANLGKISWYRFETIKEEQRRLKECRETQLQVRNNIDVMDVFIRLCSYSNSQ